MAYIHVRNINHLREVARYYDFFEFFQGPIVKGFDLEGIFVAYLNFVGYSNLTGIFTSQEIEGDTRIPKIVIKTNVKKLKKNKLRTI